jgi:hypothetical protein
VGPGSLIRDYFTRITAFGGGILRVSPIDVKAAGIRQYFIKLPIVTGARPLGFPFDEHSSSIQEWVFVFVIPEGGWGRKMWTVAD